VNNKLTLYNYSKYTFVYRIHCQSKRLINVINVKNKFVFFVIAYAKSSIICEILISFVVCLSIILHPGDAKSADADFFHYSFVKAFFFFYVSRVQTLYCNNKLLVRLTTNNKIILMKSSLNKYVHLMWFRWTDNVRIQTTKMYTFRYPFHDKIEVDVTCTSRIRIRIFCFLSVSSITYTLFFYNARFLANYRIIYIYIFATPVVTSNGFLSEW